jgi:hypothetical protein
MAELRSVVEKVRSKNAGPFWVTVDIFCGTSEAFDRVIDGLRTEAVASAFDCPVQIVKRFDIPDLRVVKLSIPRPEIQGAVADRDMHGAAWANVVAELEVD